MFKIRFWPMTASPITAMSLVASFMGATVVPAQRTVAFVLDRHYGHTAGAAPTRSRTDAKPSTNRNTATHAADPDPVLRLAAGRVGHATGDRGLAHRPDADRPDPVNGS